ncbi:MAG: hypothetical protein JWL84_548 [Rhodospirillales bacterium]|jgi:hypothetical protein|nr:hypothetical protein [Rhodospirillales bacterium]
MTVAETREAPIAPASADYDSNKPLSEIEDDIAKTRAELGETLDALERKLAPRQLLEKGVDMLRGSMDGNFEQVGETLRANPIPLALIGAGIGWLLLSRSGGSGADGNGTLNDGRVIPSRVAESDAHAAGLTDRVKHAAGATIAAAEAVYEYARPKIQHTVERTARYAAEATSRAGQAVQAGHYTEGAGRKLHTARAQLSRAMDEHPLAVGVISLAAGAALALLLPSSRVENRYLGTARNRVLGEARDRGLEALARAEEIAGAAADAATEAVRREVAGEDQARSRPL